jgi:hypothetical protein
MTHDSHWIGHFYHSANQAQSKTATSKTANGAIGKPLRLALDDALHGEARSRIESETTGPGA